MRKPLAIILAVLVVGPALGFAQVSEPQVTRQITDQWLSFKQIVLVPIGPIRSSSKLNKNGHMIKTSSQDFLAFQAIDRTEAFLLELLLRDLKSGESVEFERRAVLGDGIPAALAEKFIAPITTTCTGTCPGGCIVAGCDLFSLPGGVYGCTALSCVGSECAGQGTCSKKNSTTTP
jgi:hypothetical protein